MEIHQINEISCQNVTPLSLLPCASQRRGTKDAVSQTRSPPGLRWGQKWPEPVRGAERAPGPTADSIWTWDLCVLTSSTRLVSCPVIMHRRLRDKINMQRHALLGVNSPQDTQVCPFSNFSLLSEVLTARSRLSWVRLRLASLSLSRRAPAVV